MGMRVVMMKSDDGEDEERNCIDDDEDANGDDNHCLKWALNQNPADDSSDTILGGAFKWMIVANTSRFVTKQPKKGQNL